MSDDDSRKGFLSRWSRRKSERQSPAGDAADAAPAATGEDAFADFNFDALDFSSDFRQFMAGNVPDSVRNRALQKLWSSSDIISQPDQLDDYLEDFREEAKALHPDLVRSAYAVGRGIIDETEPAEAKPAETVSQEKGRSKTAEAVTADESTDADLEPEKPTS